MALVNDYPLANNLKSKFPVDMLHSHIDSEQQAFEAFLFKLAIDLKSDKNRPKYFKRKQLARC